MQLVITVSPAQVSQFLSDWERLAGQSDQLAALQCAVAQLAQGEKQIIMLIDDLTAVDTAIDTAVTALDATTAALGTTEAGLAVSITAAIAALQNPNGVTPAQAAPIIADLQSKVTDLGTANTNLGAANTALSTAAASLASALSASSGGGSAAPPATGMGAAPPATGAAAAAPAQTS